MYTGSTIPRSSHYSCTGRASKSRRTKQDFQGAWCAKQDDFDTCHGYAGPELAIITSTGPLWVQAFVVGLTWDLKSRSGGKSYRCIRTKDGHICTHVVFRAWNTHSEPGTPIGHSEPGTPKELQRRFTDFRLRPPLGLSDSATQKFQQGFVQSLVGAAFR